ncbi:glycosyltransferase [Acidithrix ferrooxidans]|uniref:N-acetylglucosaminyl-diphospho-decaprenol L-rhamnosyltransferase n=1 Tax=Acidithrix ferrooxidans TaxID=1280514 RepID=A0A0D8HK77_9ACTN|nr:glycosyltransferase family 2 protein [Acidithrix ferrooxidans]KJF18350.1 N-acetylglucosaminyl-diphospho-decaprenol L-rhamnosyltransferase [Acidithrix ferrooxidans]
MSSPKIASIVVNYNTGSLLCDCIGALLMGPSELIVVADNSSSDGSMELIKEKFHNEIDTSRLVLRSMVGNLGYGRAINEVSKDLLGFDLFICNPDCVISGDALLELSSFKERTNVAIAGPLIKNSDGEIYPSVRRFPSLAVSAFHAVLGQLWRNNPFSRRYHSIENESVGDDRWISGAAMLISSDLFREVGGFDERYFMFMEDVDLCRRIIAKGYDIGYDREAVAIHYQGRSSSSRPYFVAYMHHRSLLIYSSSTLLGYKALALPLVGVGVVLRFLITIAVTRYRRFLEGRTL